MGASLVLALAAAPGAGSAQAAAGYEEGLFELVIPRVGAPLTLLTLVDPDGRVLLPLRPVLEQAGIPSTTRGDTLVLEWPPDEWRTVIDAGSGIFRAGGREETLAPVEWLWSRPDLYLAPEALAALLHTDIRVSWPDLSVIVKPNPEFPAARRREIEARRAVEQRATAGPPNTIEAPSYPARTGAGAASYGFSLLHSGGVTSRSGRGSLGVAVLGGALEGGGTLNAADAEPVRIEDAYVRYIRGFPENRWLRQVQAGNVFTAGPLGRRIHGVTVTNAPLTTPRIFGEALIEPSVPTGWEYEVYHGGTLVGVGGREGAEGVRTPLNYGNTPVRMRMIGPAGQEIVEEMVFVVRPEHVPAGSWRHFVGAGRCIDAGCDRYGYGEVRHGVSNRLTAGFGAEYTTFAEEDPAWRPYGYLGTRFRPNLVTDLQLQPGSFLRSNVQLHTARRGSLGASYASYRPSNSSGAEVWHAQLTASRPVALLDGRIVNGRVLVRGRDPGKVDSRLASVSTSVRRTYATVELESGLQRSDVLALRTYTTLPGGGRAWLRDPAVSLSAGASRHGGELLEVGASIRPLESATFSTGLRLRRGGGATFTLSLVARLSPGYVQGRSVQGPAGGSHFSSVSGGVAWAPPEPRPMLLPFESVGRAGVTGTVFYDHSGDGEMGPGDEPVPDAVVVVGGSRVRTDASGRFRAWHLDPYEPTVVAVDSLTVDHAWIPSAPTAAVRPSPNVFSRVDVPLVRTRELLGRVEAASGELRTVGGILVEILSDGGELVTTARTFSDGEFYLARMGPGTYEVRIADESLAALGARSEPASRRVEIDVRGNRPVEVPPLRLSRR